MERAPRARAVRRIACLSLGHFLRQRGCGRFGSRVFFGLLSVFYVTFSQ